MKFVYLFIGLFVYLLIAQAAMASPLSLSINPPIIEINALAPSIAQTSLTIQNKSDSEVNLKIELRPFKAKSENGELEFLENASSEYAKEAVFLKNVQILDNEQALKNITLGPKQERRLTLNINIPQESSIYRPTSPATPACSAFDCVGVVAGERADYYFSITFISDNNATPTTSASLNQLGIASNVLLSIGPKELPQVFISDFSTGIFFESGPVPFTLRVKNKGAHFVKPKGEILIKNMFGQSIGKLDLLRVNILSDSIRAIPNNLYMQELRSQDNLDSKTKSKFNFENPKILWKEGFLLGFYTATLTLALSDQGPTFTKSIHFFAFPFQGLIIIVIIAIAIIVVRNRLKTYMKNPSVG